MKQRKLKVAFVCQPWDNFVPPAQSGSIPIWTYEVIQPLKDECEFVVYSKQKKGQARDEVREGIHCRRFSIAPDKVSHKFLHRIPFVSRRVLPFFGTRLYHTIYSRNVAIDLQRHPCDLVHVMNFSQFVPVIRSFNPDVKIALNMHCEWLTQLAPQTIQRRLTKTDMVIGCSEFVTRQVRQAFPAVANCCQTVFNGVNVHRFIRRQSRQSRQGEKRLLFVGRLSPEKGIHVLLEAFERVVCHEPNATLKIVGPDGAAPIDFLVNISRDPMIRNLAAFYDEIYTQQLKKRLSPSIADRVSFEGFVSHSDLVDYYNNADLLVNSSLWESFGRNLIEAMACGLPVVATRIGGIPEIVDDGQTGLLVEPNNADALAGAILRLLDNPNDRDAMGEAGLRKVKELFSWEAVAQELLARYREVVGSYA